MAHRRREGRSSKLPILKQSRKDDLSPSLVYFAQI
jgi:hypothetical protein